jgi:hypothetical protein
LFRHSNTTLGRTYCANVIYQVYIDVEYINRYKSYTDLSTFQIRNLEFRLWEGKKPGDFRENLEIHAVMGKSIPDWKVWKLCGEDFENLIVNI